MRIVGGSLGGRRLKAPAGQDTRPTPERVREALFSILGGPIADTRVLDPFAGAGCLGLEALSRGAKEVVFVDNSRKAIRCIRENVANLGLEAQTHIHMGDAMRTIAELSGCFDWIFVDPPYASDLAARTLDLLDRLHLVSANGVVVVEHDRRDVPADDYGSLRRTDRRRYGDTELSFYRHEQGQSE